MNNESKLPQPFELEGMTRESWLEQAHKKEREGQRLVVNEYVNAYLDAHDDWVLDGFVVRDFRTQEALYVWTEDVSPEFDFDYTGTFTVENRIVEA